MSSRFDEIRRLNKERATAALYLWGMKTMNTPTDEDARIAADARHRLAVDLAAKTEAAYRAAVDALTPSELLDLINEQTQNIGK